VTILSGNLEPVIRPFCLRFGWQCRGSQPEEKAGIYSGRLTGPVFVREEKRKYVEGRGGDLASMVGFGNSKNDIPFLSAIGNPFAVRPDSRLLSHSIRLDWNLSCRDPGAISRWGLLRHDRITDE
jgi:phosphoserine phosphatase